MDLINEVIIEKNRANNKKEYEDIDIHTKEGYNKIIQGILFYIKSLNTKKCKEGDILKKKSNNLTKQELKKENINNDTMENCSDSESQELLVKQKKKSF